MEAVKGFLINAALTALAIGLPTVFIWLRSGRRLPLMTCYHRALLHIARCFGFTYMSISIVFLVLALSDLIGARSNGYPAFAVPMAALMGAIGCTVWLVASRSLRRHLSMNEPSD